MGERELIQTMICAFDFVQHIIICIGIRGTTYDGKEPNKQRRGEKDGPVLHWGRL